MTGAGPGVLTVANQKGGVGKTTTTVNLAAALTHMENRVLVVDLDSSSTATAVLLGVDADVKHTVDDVLAPNGSLRPEDARAAVVPSRWPGVDVLPSDFSLAERDQDGDVLQERLGTALGHLEEYDWALIDAPPHLGRLLGSAVLASDSVLLVTEPAAVSFYGLAHLRRTMHAIGEGYGHRVDIAGIAVNKVQTGTVAHRAALRRLWEEHGDHILGLIPQRVPIAEALNSGVSLYALASTSRGRSAAMLAQEYEHLAARLIGLPAPPVALPFDTSEAARAAESDAS
ncbi:ParA family protein [Quadrisphaera sp. DSM 44207]|uniref:ParA family protein n=1 Tax=Quadrisphaera sp. DSM 44207 TaxID=1881057 RepID=UPI000884BFAE|nr:ParA family protein [Quadrisphaera sp. DSM 44207]SDQ78298.1 chromosome partitioning protein [Quadrisphaera sp. DSM 44207]